MLVERFYKYVDCLSGEALLKKLHPHTHKNKITLGPPMTKMILKVKYSYSSNADESLHMQKRNKTKDDYQT